MSVYQNRSFSRASSELNLSQPSVSSHIRKLEDELGVQLFDRLGRQTLPTRQGDLLYSRARDIMEQLGGLRHDLAESQSEIEGIITVGACTIPGSYILPRYAAEFRRIHPGVFFRVDVQDSGKIATRVSSGELVMGIVDDRKSGKGLKCPFKFEDQLLLVTQPDYLDTREISPAQLTKIPLILREEDSDSRKSMDRHHLLHRIQLKYLNVAAVLGTPDSVREAVKSGLGAAIISRYAVHDDLQAGLLEEITVKGVRMRRSFYLITHPRRSLSARDNTFLEYLRTRLLQ